MCFFKASQPRPRSTLFPYTTLFRSPAGVRHRAQPPRLAPRGRPLHRPHPNPGGARDSDEGGAVVVQDRKSTRLNSSHVENSYAVFCLKKKTTKEIDMPQLNSVRPMP